VDATEVRESRIRWWWWIISVGGNLGKNKKRGCADRWTVASDVGGILLADTADRIRWILLMAGIIER
jgi:hypothetical protein